MRTLERDKLETASRLEVTVASVERTTYACISTKVQCGAIVGLAAVALSTSSSEAARRPVPPPSTTTAPPTTFAPRPFAAPTNLRLYAPSPFFAPSSTSFSVIWDPTAGATTYSVFLNGVNRLTDTCSGSAYCFGDDAVSATFRGLTAATTYRVAVVANASGSLGGNTTSPRSTEFVFATP